MKVGICAPITISSLSHYLPLQDRANLPKALRGVSVAQLALALLERGWELRVYTLGEVSSGVTLEGDQLKIVIGPYRPARRARDFFKEERTFLKSVLERDRPELIHAHWTYEFALASLSTGVPTLITVRDWAPAILRLHRDPYRFVRLLMSLQVLRQGKEFTAVSPYIARAMERATRKPIRMIPNAVHDEHFVSVRRRFPAGPHTIVSINNGFSKRKNATALLKAFVVVRRTLPDARLILVGSGYEPNGRAYRWAEENLASQNVTFAGEVPYDEVHGLLAEASLLIHSSLEESFGMTLIEAMAKRTPVIGGSDSGAVPWVLNDGAAGALVDVRDPTAMAEKALQILLDARTWEDISEAGFAHASREFRLSKTVDDYIAAYEEVAQR